MPIVRAEPPIKVYTRIEDIVQGARFFGDEASTKPILEWVANAGWEAHVMVDLDSDTVLVLKPGTGKGAPFGDRLYVYPGEYIVKRANNTLVVCPEVNFSNEYRRLGDAL